MKRPTLSGRSRLIGGTDYATNIYSLEGQMRLRTWAQTAKGDHDGSHLVLDLDVAGDGANQTTKIYKVPIPYRAKRPARNTSTKRLPKVVV